MSARIEAGRLTHVDLGKTVKVGPLRPELVLVAVSHTATSVHLVLSKGSFLGEGHTSESLDPHTLVTVTGKDQA